jgi:hypothetical protein
MGAKGRDMAQAVSRRPLNPQARVRSRVSPCGICGGQSGIGIYFSPSTSVFPCQFHSTGAPLQGKTKKLIFFITGLHNKSQGCCVSTASAAGPFATNKYSATGNVRDKTRTGRPSTISRQCEMFEGSLARSPLRSTRKRGTKLFSVMRMMQHNRATGHLRLVSCVVNCVNRAREYCSYMGSKL